MQLTDNEIFNRSTMLIGKENTNKLAKSCVAVFGIGGVGSYAAETLARSGVGKIILVDYDEIKASNINRQIHASIHTIGQKKVSAMAERIKGINPYATVVEKNLLFNEKSLHDVFGADEKIDYCIDAIDMISSKLLLIEYCKNNDIPVISSMGTGNKLDAGRFKVTDIYKTHTCPLAKVMRNELKKRGIKSLDVVFSDEIPTSPDVTMEMVEEEGSEVGKRRITPGSMSFVPPISGIFMTSHVVNKIINEHK